MPVAAQAAACASGKYASGDQCLPCPAGHFCTDGAKTVCPGGTYSTGGASECKSFDDGMCCSAYNIDGVVSDGYTQLEYIHSTGVQQIDTGISTMDLSGTYEYEITLSDINEENNKQSLLGSISNNNARSGILVHNPSGHMAIGAGETLGGDDTISYEYDNTQKHTIRVIIDDDAKTINVWQDDVQQITNANYTGTIKNNNTIKIFLVDELEDEKSFFRCYSVTISDNGNIVRDFIPVRRDTDNAIGMYDLVEGKFYENTGTENFVLDEHAACTGQQRCYCETGHYIDSEVCSPIDYGYYGIGCSDLPPGYIELTYLVSDGKQWFDTDYYPNQDTEMYARFMSSTNNGYVYAARNPANTTNVTAYASTSGNWRFANKTIEMATPSTLVESVQNKTGVWFNGTKVATYSGISNFQSEYPMRIFWAPNVTYGTSHQRFAGNVYVITAKENGVDKLNLVPVQRTSDGKVGMYDTIGQRFYVNTGAGDFVAGGYTSCIGQAICPALTPNARYTYNCHWKCVSGFGLNSLNTCSEICTSGFTKLRTGSGINVPLFTVKNTSPSIVVGDYRNMCYADLIQGMQNGGLNAQYKGQTYHTMNVVQ